MSVNLTANAITAIFNGDRIDRPSLQVLTIKSIGTDTDKGYMLLISDGMSYQRAMLVRQLNERVTTGQVIRGSVVQLTDYVLKNVNSRKFIGVKNMETISRECEIIGKPKFNPAEKPMGCRPTVQPAYQPPPNYRNQGTLMKNEAPARIIPISDLNPSQGPWAIKARVTAKGALLRDDKSVGDFKMIYFDLLDSDGGEIRVICSDAVVDRFYDTIEVGKVYVISKGSLKPAQKNFNHLKNEWEIFLEVTSTVDLCPDEDALSPQLQSMSEENQQLIPEPDSAGQKDNQLDDELMQLLSNLGKSMCKVAGATWEDENDEVIRKKLKDRCPVCKRGEVDSAWVQCEGERCGLWFHTFCVGLGRSSKAADELAHYKCATCDI